MVVRVKPESGDLAVSVSESGIRKGQFGNVSGHFVDPNRGVLGNDPLGLEQRQQRGVGLRRRRDVKTSQLRLSPPNIGDGKKLKASGCRDENDDSKVEAEPSSGKLVEVEQKAQPAEPPKQDYIHVRARRGQATDSHSLAERARREKISERMKILQDLVPGCNKVIGKALVLDEIINYIQSLQRQVEFLSMKLEAVNSRMNPAIEVFPLKDYGQQTFDTTGMAFGSQATREYSRVVPKGVYCIPVNQRECIFFPTTRGIKPPLLSKRVLKLYALLCTNTQTEYLRIIIVVYLQQGCEHAEAFRQFIHSSSSSNLKFLIWLGKHMIDVSCISSFTAEASQPALEMNLATQRLPVNKNEQNTSKSKAKFPEIDDFSRTISEILLLVGIF
ncbi:hypothetical protein V6N12_020983 [Hibiscus sabdariffa]|uniref:BHLH domain-containing protein n=1 Tax=Hibiscus sabdariffa TaxID=183260 RepID=A0ABR2CZM6_9ROSI